MLSVEVDRKAHLLAFCHITHFPQKRKYTGEAYTVHLRAVAEMADRYNLLMGYEIGLCHDLLEDTYLTANELDGHLTSFGYDEKESFFIVSSVIELTDVYTSEAFPKLNRAERKELECKRLSEISENSQSIKYCDLIDNTSSILKYDEGFAKIYLKEKFAIMQVMDKGNNDLYNIAMKNIA